jgi:hypothetical protein
MKCRFFDIVVENENGEQPVSGEYILDLPEHSTETAMDRQEFLGVMFDNIVAASGLNVCSFSSEEIEI